MNGVRLALRGTGQTLITAGLVILLFVLYELWYTGFYTAREQRSLKHELQHEWTQPLTDGIARVRLGHGIAILRIPRLGAGYSKVVVEGVATADLKKGPGHYPGTALPGQVGNFVVSGHRTTYGAPFNRLDEVRPGDAIVLETRSRWYTYVETCETIVDPSADWVLAANPLAPTGESCPHPAKRMLTFTTCNPKYSAAQRLILFGKLLSTQAKSAGLPPALRSGA